MTDRRRRASDYWDRTAGDYDAGFVAMAGADLIEALGRVVADAVPPGEVVEFGCGTGLFTRAYASRCRQVVATDASMPMIAAARRNLADLPQVSVQQADATATDLPAGTADAVVAVNLLHIVPDPAAVLAEALRLLRPGGTLLVACLSGEGVAPWRLLRVGWRLLRRWGAIPGRRDLTRARLTALLQAAGFEVRESTVVAGQRMNAVYARAVAPSARECTGARAA